jgi:uncharacterized membrane protein YccC
MNACAAFLQRVQWVRGLRAASAVGVAMATSHALGLPPAAAALGAFNPLLVDNGGPYRTRLTTMLTTIFGGAIAYIAGALVPGHLPVIILITMLTAFTVTYGRVLSQQMASSSVLILVLYFAGLGGTVHTLREALIAAGIVLLGGAWSVVLSLLLWPIDTFRPARQAVAACYHGMEAFTSGLAHIAPETAAELEHADPHFEWRRNQRIRIEEARATLSGTAARAPSRTVRFRNLTVLLETSDMLLARAMRLSELQSAAARADLTASFELATDVALWLAVAEHAVAVALDARPADTAASFGYRGSSRLQFVDRRRERIRERAAQPALQPHDSLYAYILREERDALLELEIVFDAIRALWTGLEAPSSHLAATLVRDLSPGWQEALQRNFTMESAAFRHALRMMVVAAVDVVVMRLIHVNHGFWLPMTSIILIQPFSAGTLRKSVQRITGTVAGGILAALLAALVAEPLAISAIVTVLGALTVATFAVDYAVFCLFLTPTFVLLSLPHPYDWQYAFIRIGTTLAGALIAIVAMRCLWPERADVELGQLMRRSAGAAANYLQAMLDFWSFEQPVLAPVERQFLAPARRACGLASNDTEEAVDRILQEPTFGHRNTAETVLRNESLTFVTYMRRLTQSITTLALVGTGSPEGRHRLAPIAADLARLAEGALAPPARSDGERLPLPLDLAEEQMQRIERQTAVLLRAAAAIHVR